MGGVTHSGSGAVVAVAGLMPRDRSKCESFVICCSDRTVHPGRAAAAPAGYVWTLDGDGEERRIRSSLPPLEVSIRLCPPTNPQ